MLHPEGWEEEKKAHSVLRCEAIYQDKEVYLSTCNLVSDAQTQVHGVDVKRMVYHELRVRIEYLCGLTLVWSCLCAFLFLMCFYLLLLLSVMMC